MHGISSSLAIVIISKPLSLELIADGVEVTDAKWFDITDSLPEIQFDTDKYIIGKLKEWIISKTEISGILLSERQTNFTQL
jgi:NADH pyrophosphatase NudC (nudix superfamily)